MRVKGGLFNPVFFAIFSCALGLVAAQEYYFDSKEQKIRSCIMTIELFRWSVMCALYYTITHSARQDSRDILWVTCSDPTPVNVLLAMQAYIVVDFVAALLPIMIVAGLKYMSVREDRRLLISAMSTIFVAIIVAVSVVFAVIKVLPVHGVNSVGTI